MHLVNLIGQVLLVQEYIKPSTQFESSSIKILFSTIKDVLISLHNVHSNAVEYINLHTNTH